MAFSRGRKILQMALAKPYVEVSDCCSENISDKSSDSDIVNYSEQDECLDDISESESDSEQKFLQSEKGKPKLYDESHLYIRDKDNGDKTHWKCEHSKKFKCSARVTTEGDEIIKRWKEHNHVADAAFTSTPTASTSEEEELSKTADVVLIKGKWMDDVVLQRTEKVRTNKPRIYSRLKKNVWSDIISLSHCDTEDTTLQVVVVVLVVVKSMNFKLYFSWISLHYSLQEIRRITGISRKKLAQDMIEKNYSSSLNLALHFPKAGGVITFVNCETDIVYLLSKLGVGCYAEEADVKNAKNI
ncbi:hypothetical protein FQR65_LT15908 [Abscondita terminalis]|nr:hypothetical protein FQR65_LT15908 [Abscondita terminalis]